MQDMHSRSAYHMCSACGLSCGSGVQNMHSPAEVVSHQPYKKFKRYFKPQWQVGRPWL